MSAVLETREPGARYLEALQPALVRQFELLATAEGGVARLRELILTLAVQGKLVPQCPGEAPASNILARARAAAAEQRRERRKRASNDIEPSESDEGLPALPRGWEWCRGVDLYTVVRGVTYQKTDASDSPRDNYLPILRANNIRTTINFDDLVYVPGNLVTEEQLLRPGDYVVCLASGSKNLVGKAAMFTAEKVCSFGAFCGVIRLAVPLPFFSVFLASPLYRDAVSEASSGIGINNLKSTTLLGLAIALPPEEEQARIAARVDELMRLCDALEDKGRLEAEQHARLLGTLLGTLTDGVTPKDLLAKWQRVAENFDSLLDRPEAIDELEQRIIQLAVRGVVVPQDVSDEPASELFASILAAKQRLIAEGKVKRARALEPVVEEDAPFALPAGWMWVRLGSLLQKIGAGSTPLGGKDVYVPRGIKFLRSQNVWNDGLRLEGVAFIRPETHAKMASTAVQPNDLLFNITGASIGRCAVVPADFDEANVSQHVTIIRPVLPDLNQFLHLVLISQHVQQTVMDVQVGVSREGLSIAKLESFPVPLPPLAEQARIVTRVAEIRRLCADLRQRLADRRTIQARLAEALVESATA